ncbi:MAG: hypothetical protein KA712_07815 [Myxococcales bacterium]|nr:hypothetical protein [Myxococcales bacterium]
MSPSAITERLKSMAAAQRHRGYVAKGVDMSPAAISSRLKMQSQLTNVCLRLGQLRPRAQES